MTYQALSDREIQIPDFNSERFNQDEKGSFKLSQPDKNVKTLKILCVLMLVSSASLILLPQLLQRVLFTVLRPVEYSSTIYETSFLRQDRARENKIAAKLEAIKLYDSSINQQISMKVINAISQSQNSNLQLRSLQSNTIDNGKAKSIYDQQKAEIEEDYKAWKDLNQQSALCIMIIEKQSRSFVPDDVSNEELFQSLNSVIQQEYQPFKIVYLTTNQKNRNFVQNYQKKFKISEQKLQIYQKLKSKTPLENIYHQGKSKCSQDSIIIVLNQGDVLIGRQALNHINYRYNIYRYGTQKIQVFIGAGIYKKNGYYLKGHPERVYDQTDQLSDQCYFKPDYLYSFRANLLKSVDTKNLRNSQRKFYQLGWQHFLMREVVKNVQQNLIQVFNVPLYKVHQITRYNPQELKKIRSQVKSIENRTPRINITNPFTNHFNKIDLVDPYLGSMVRGQQDIYKTYLTRREVNITAQQYQRAINTFEILHNYDKKSENRPSQQEIKYAIELEKLYYQEKYPQIRDFEGPENELSFCVVVPSYKNNKQNKLQKNLDSIFLQNYTQYHVVFIDDFSQDGTVQAVQQYREKNNIPNEKLQLISNQKNLRALPNIFNAAHNYCRSGEIMMIVDGDDFLLGRQVFRLLNSQYQSKPLLTIYTNYLRMHNNVYLKVGTSISYKEKTIQNRSMRKDWMFRASHLRTFYVDLFRKIKLTDLQDQNGKFLVAANDFAIMMPVLEMSSSTFTYLPELTYVYDSSTGQNNFLTKSKEQAKSFELTKSRPIYDELTLQQLGFLRKNVYKNFKQHYNKKTENEDKFQFLPI